MTSPRNPQRPAPLPTPASTNRLLMGNQSFTEKVMVMVQAEPRPTPARVFLRSLMALQLRDAAAALSTVRRLGFGRTHSVSRTRRLQSLAVIAIVVAIVGIGGPMATSSALNVLGLGQGPQLPLPGSSGPSFTELVVEASPSIDDRAATPEQGSKADSEQKTTNKPRAGTRKQRTIKPSGSRQQTTTKPRAGTKSQTTGKPRAGTRKQTTIKPPRVRDTPEPGDDGHDDSPDSRDSDGDDEEDEPEDD